MLLNEAAVTVFKAERRRAADERAQSAARQRWLRLAHKVNASPNRCARLAAAPISSEIVEASRALYLATADRAVKAARHDGRWGDIGRIRRDQARALYDEAGAPVSPPENIARLHREGMVAVLRSLQPLANEVELVSAKCCAACRSEDGQTFRIVDEARLARLPHVGCPLGLCGCDWWPAMVEPKRAGRRARVPRVKRGASADAGPDSWAAAS